MKCVLVPSFVLILAGCATTPPPAAATPTAKSLDYMAALRKEEGDAAAAGDDASKKRSAWQAVAVEQSVVGDTERAIESFRVSGLRASAIPMDQVLVTAGETPPKLMLPKGKYRFAYQD